MFTLYSKLHIAVGVDTVSSSRDSGLGDSVLAVSPATPRVRLSTTPPAPALASATPDRSSRLLPDPAVCSIIIIIIIIITTIIIIVFILLIIIFTHLRIGRAICCRTAAAGAPALGGLNPAAAARSPAVWDSERYSAL